MKTIKNHVTGVKAGRGNVTDTATIVKASNDKFGNIEALMTDAFSTDPKKSVTAMQQVGQMGLDALRLEKDLPKVKEHIQKWMEQTTAYNQTVSSLYQTGGKGATDIQKAQNDLKLANLGYIQGMKELSTSYALKTAEMKERHGYSMEAIQLSSALSRVFAKVDSYAKIASLNAQPLLKQIDADKSRNDQVNQHVLSYGDNQVSYLIPDKKYNEATSNPVSGMLKGFAKKVGMYV